MKELSKTIINKLINDQLKVKENKDDKTLRKKISLEIDKYYSKKAVLGFDIYRYSQYPSLQQTLIPHLFKELYELTIKNCLVHEPEIFKDKEEKEFISHFIDAGDGGFQIFDTPFQAVVFAIYFQANIKRYNSGIFPDSLTRIIGEITLRYSLTYNHIYCYEKNFYGPAIITNARIMSRDQLNRFLTDENTIDWFTKELNGIENLQVITLKDDFKNLPFLNGFELNNDIMQTVLFEPTRAKILNVDLLKVGEIKSKQDVLSIYSLHIQSSMTTTGNVKFKKYTITLGNLNSSGITD